LSLSFDTDDGVVSAVRDVSLSLNPGETLALVGESGCGKSVTAMSALRLVPCPPGRYAAGRILFDGQDVLGFSDEAMEGLRGNDISMIFQEPMTSLNPLFTIGFQIAEAILLHQRVSLEQARELTLEALRKVAMPSPEKRIDQYPHELSGGMKQRVMIAMAIACRPRLLIADEPTTALDATVQGQILDLLHGLRESTGMAILLITHNLGIVAEFADRVAVMYAGKVVEEAPVVALFESPLHPYTRGLLGSLPKEDPNQPLDAIAGTVPHPAMLPAGCAFHPRCPDVMDKCRSEQPPELKPEAARRVACWLYEEGRP